MNFGIFGAAVLFTKHKEVLQTQAQTAIYNEQNLESPKHDELMDIQKIKSESTSTTLDDSSQQEEQQIVSVDVLQFQSMIESQMVLGDESMHRSCQSIQNSTVVKATLVNNSLNTNSICRIHNQLQMENQLNNHQISPEESKLEANHACNGLKQTPNTECSEGPSQNHVALDKNEPVTPNFTSNCQIKPELNYSFKDQISMIDLAKAKVQPTQPKKGVYYKNRANLIQWLRNECVKLQLSRDTFGTAVFLMDQYFKHSCFNSNEFLAQAVSIIIISSKMNDIKVLFTGRMTEFTGISGQVLFKREIQMLLWFKYKINCYSFVRVVTEFMKRWDQVAKKEKIPIDLLLQEKLESFLMYQELFFLCENQLRFNRELLTSSILLIFKEFAMTKLKDIVLVQKLISGIFEDENPLAAKELEFVFECVIDEKQYEEYINSVKISLASWMSEFECKKQSLVKKFVEYKERGIVYANFINIEI